MRPLKGRRNERRRAPPPPFYLYIGPTKRFPPLHQTFSFSSLNRRKLFPLAPVCRYRLLSSPRCVWKVFGIRPTPRLEQQYVVLCFDSCVVSAIAAPFPSLSVPRLSPLPFSGPFCVAPPVFNCLLLSPSLAASCFFPLPSPIFWCLTPSSFSHSTSHPCVSQ